MRGSPISPVKHATNPYWIDELLLYYSIIVTVVSFSREKCRMSLFSQCLFGKWHKFHNNNNKNHTIKVGGGVNETVQEHLLSTSQKNPKPQTPSHIYIYKISCLNGNSASHQLLSLEGTNCESLLISVCLHNLIVFLTKTFHPDYSFRCLNGWLTFNESWSTGATKPGIIRK